MRQLIVALVVAIAWLAPRPAAAQVEAFEWRQVLFAQQGHGFQSLDGERGEPGSQAAVIVEPMFFLQFKQAPRVTHEVAVEIDIVTAASPDAIDAMTSASKVNEAVQLDVTHRWAHDEHGEVFGRWSVHVEEPLRSASMGGGYKRRFLDDNFTITASGLYSFDDFDAYGPYGDRPGLYNRYLGNGNLSISQVLSPTTILDVGYGLTYQKGVLETTWNAVPTLDGTIEREVQPPSRVRHAATVRVSQHLPSSHTTGKLSYRLYHDDFGLDAHTAQAWLYQYLKPWVYLRLGYRFHSQDGVDFYKDLHPDDPDGSRTSDSDLAPFRSHEVTAKIAVLGERAPFQSLGRATVDATLGRYGRTNDLSLYWGSVSLGYKF